MDIRGRRIFFRAFKLRHYFTVTESNSALVWYRFVFRLYNCHNNFIALLKTWCSRLITTLTFTLASEFVRISLFVVENFNSFPPICCDGMAIKSFRNINPTFNNIFSYFSFWSSVNEWVIGHAENVLGKTFCGFFH